MATRFGRSAVALEHVKPSARDEFGRKHADWGRGLRIVDSETSQVSVRADGDADVILTISWHRANDTTMRETELAQHWHEVRGTWWLVNEEERAGDPGLLRDSAPHPSTDASRISPPQQIDEHEHVAIDP
jgi:hypothetical protein